MIVWLLRIVWLELAMTRSNKLCVMLLFVSVTCSESVICVAFDVVAFIVLFVMLMLLLDD